MLDSTQLHYSLLRSPFTTLPISCTLGLPLLLAVACSAEPAETAPRAVVPDVLVRFDGLAAPEHVIYDAARDRYLVSNVNGEPNSADDNGFISILSPSGHIHELKWIESGRNGVKLNAPKGLALAHGSLYVTDIDVVRRFDASTGEHQADIEVPGSTFLNGLSAAADGKLYLSDSGPPRGTLDGIGTESIFVIDGDKVERLADGELGRPMGLAATETGLLVSSFGEAQVLALSADGKQRRTTELPAGGIAGVVLVDDTIFVTSWQASAVFHGKLGGEFKVALPAQQAPGDLGYDSKRQRLLVPHFQDDNVEVFALEPEAP
jgi:sugar lactone lactonase YvrE